MSNGNNPYEDFFELTQADYDIVDPESYKDWGAGTPYSDFGTFLTSGQDISSDINWDNPSAEEIAMIQQDPNLQAKYLQNIMKEGSYFGTDTPVGTGFLGVENVGQLGMQEIADTLWGRYQGDPDFDKEYLQDLFGTDVGSGTDFAPYMSGFTQTQQDDFINYFLDMQSGMRTLGGGDVGISALERELGLAERGVIGPGGLTSQRKSIADILQKNIGRRREAYIQPEKASRYSGLGGRKTPDPTESYLSGVYSDVGTYETGISGVNKSIFDILHGTGQGSIFDIYGDYAEGVEKSLSPFGEPWYGG